MSVFDRTLTHARTAVARARLGLGLQPLSERWGYDRGVSVHRRYITDFLEAHAHDVRGHVLEFNDPGYTREVGGGRVTKSDVVHLDDTNPQATIVADLTGPNTVPSDTFDCVIATHVLHVIFEPLTILREQLVTLASQPNSTLGIGLLISIPLALWSGSRGVDALLYAMSQVRNETPRRGIIKTILVAVGTTLVGSIFVVVALAKLVAARMTACSTRTAHRTKPWTSTARSPSSISTTSPPPPRRQSR